jgi:pyruvate formate lyase activating enzyme
VCAPGELETVPFEAVRAHLASSDGWIDGVVITGGEPCLEGGLENLIDELRRLKLSIKLDTNGSRPEVLERLIKAGKVQAVSMDVKAPLRQPKYSEVAGTEVELEKVAASVDFLLSSPVGVEVEFRTTVCPAFLDEEDLIEIAGRIAGAPRFVLQEFKPLNCLDKRLLEVEPYPLTQMKQMLSSVQKYVPNASIRGYKD